MKRSAKIKANNNRRRNRRVWNGVVSKLSTETIPPVFYEEDAEDRYERHMKPIREAQAQQL